MRWRYGFLVLQGGLSLLLYFSLGAALPSAEFARAATALGALVVAQAIADFGLSQAAVALLPNPNALGRRFGPEDMAAGAARTFAWAAIAAGALTAVLAVATPDSARLAVLLVAPAAAATVLVAGADGILRASGEFRRPVEIVTLSRLAALAGLPAAIATDSAVWGCAFVSLGTVVGSLPAAAFLRDRLQAGSAVETHRRFLTAALPLGLSNAVVVASTRANTVILAAVASLSAAAVFESAWRLFQVGQYVLGGAATAVVPFVANALAEERYAESRRMLLRWSAAMAGSGMIFAAGLLAVRGPVCDWVFGDLGDDVARAVAPLAAILPLSLLTLVAIAALSATSHTERLWISASYSVGLVVNLIVVLWLATSDPLLSGSLAAAAGITATSLFVGYRFSRLLLRLGVSASPRSEAVRKDE